MFGLNISKEAFQSFVFSKPNWKTNYYEQNFPYLFIFCLSLFFLKVQSWKSRQNFLLLVLKFSRTKELKKYWKYVSAVPLKIQDISSPEKILW